MEASGAGHAEVVTALIAAGADVNAATKVLREGNVQFTYKLTWLALLTCSSDVRHS
jgi:hypothetical protein